MINVIIQFYKKSIIYQRISLCHPLKSVVKDSPFFSSHRQHFLATLTFSASKLCHLINSLSKINVARDSPLPLQDHHHTLPTLDHLHPLNAETLPQKCKLVIFSFKLKIANTLFSAIFSFGGSKWTGENGWSQVVCFGH